MIGTHATVADAAHRQALDPRVHCDVVHRDAAGDGVLAQMVKFTTVASEIIERQGARSIIDIVDDRIDRRVAPQHDDGTKYLLARDRQFLRWVNDEGRGQLPPVPAREILVARIDRLYAYACRLRLIDITRHPVIGSHIYHRRIVPVVEKRRRPRGNGGTRVLDKGILATLRHEHGVGGHTNLAG